MVEIKEKGTNPTHVGGTNNIPNLGFLLFFLGYMHPAQAILFVYAHTSNNGYICYTYVYVFSLLNSISA